MYFIAAFFIIVNKQKTTQQIDNRMDKWWRAHSMEQDTVGDISELQQHVTMKQSQKLYIKQGEKSKSQKKMYKVQKQAKLNNKFG